MGHCNLQRGLINWEPTDQIGRGMIVLLGKSKVMDKENIWKSKDSQPSYCRGHLCFCGNYQKVNRFYLHFKKSSRESYEGVLIASFYLDKENT